MYTNKKPKTIVARINLNLIDTLMFIKMTVKNIFLNKRPVSCLSSKYHISIDTQSINKQANMIKMILVRENENLEERDTD